MENPIDPARLRAVLALRDLRRSALVRRLGISESYFTAQVSGERPLSSDVTRAIREVLGDDAWAFVTGASDALRATTADATTPTSPRRAP